MTYLIRSWLDQEYRRLPLLLLLNLLILNKLQIIYSLNNESAKTF